MFEITLKSDTLSLPIRICVDGKELVLDNLKPIELPVPTAVVDAIEQIALPVMATEAKAEVEENARTETGFFTIGYSPVFEDIRKIIACGWGVDRHYTKRIKPSNAKITVKEGSKGKMKKASSMRKGSDFRMTFDEQISIRGNKALTDFLIYFSKLVKEQCWQGRDFVRDVVMLLPQNYKAFMQYVEITDENIQLRRNLGALKQATIQGSASQDARLTETGEPVPLICDFEEKDGVFYIKIDAYLWRILTEQDFVLPRCYFSVDKAESNMMFNIFSEIKLGTRYSAVPKTLFMNIEYLCNKGMHARWEKDSSETINDRLQKILKNIERVLGENSKQLGILIQSIKTDQIEVSVSKKISAHYQNFKHESCFGLECLDHDKVVVPSR